MDGQRVLVTGGLGFVGSNIVRLCLDLGADVTVYDCLDPKSGGNMYNIADVEDSVNVVLNDIRNFEGISQAIRNQDVLFNCAAFTSHPNSMREPIVDIDVNCKGVINILEAGRRFNPDIKLVHIGTSTQVGKMLHSPVDETHPEFPVDIYSANKSASEKYVLIYGSAYAMRTTVIRLANIYGPRSNIRTPDFGFVNYFIGLALQGKELTVFGDGAQLRTLTYVDDCVLALVMAAQNPETDGEVFFAVSDGQFSVLQIAEAIVDHVGGSLRLVEWPRDRESIEIGDAVISNHKIKGVLNWNADTSLVAGLVATREYFAPRLRHYLG
jgi:UDP-glucose 4-epimerase